VDILGHFTEGFWRTPDVRVNAVSVMYVVVVLAIRCVGMVRVRAGAGDKFYTLRSVDNLLVTGDAVE
jgi:hypothetical protein